MDELYSIGEVARRTGLSVSAIRFYSDAGIVTPAEHTDAGYRRYDVDAIARLELIRTLRELDAGIDDIRKLLAEEIALGDLATAHLAVVDRQLSRFRARRAVLRTIVRQRGTTEQVSLMHKLVTMSDEEREQLVDDFSTEFTAGLGIDDFVDYLRPWRPRLPADPTSEQLEAWIELADLVQDADFRQAVRRYFSDTFAGPPADQRTQPQPPAEGTDPEADHTADSQTDAEVEQLVELLTEARDAAEAGLPVDSPQARELAGRYLAAVAARADEPDAAAVRRQLAAADPGRQVSRYAELLGRYQSLTATINGVPQPKAVGAPATTWLHAAVTALP
ncbi:MerR family transcriptional regulator [Micromonospora sp. NBC_01813]|uniref:MerR family transcriptional regulator n=1 Tax=Micromonospora sp. NBC_01813 TaxID=2975988 RepID=UPI002DD837F1|nr:MerR family transcriptional regulator [Micromonospora sp. NBC_01813]WSA07356.1 MerR family transcriptional regulator [Micromonospora sp. NBC_01813]